jgi:hypothetical protein
LADRQLLILITAGLLTIQPDAAQETAFAVAIGMQWLLRKRARDAMGFIVLAGTLGLVLVAWMRPDPLGSVPHVEGIIKLATALGPVYAAAAVVSLILLPVPFFVASHQWRGSRKGDTALALGAYFTATLLAPTVSNYPVPLMGYGASPILGFFFALGWISFQSTLWLDQHGLRRSDKQRTCG